MNKLLLPILAGTILPLVPLQAAPGKTFGGFKPGKTFTLTVTDRESIKTTNGDVDRGVPIPSGLPKFKVGDKVKFTIGDKGALRGPGFKIQYEDNSGMRNFYSNEPSGSVGKGDNATVRRGDKKTATLVFYKYKLSGFKLTTNSVTYKLKN